MKKLAYFVVFVALLLFAFAQVPKIVKNQIQTQIYTDIEDLPAKPVVLVLGSQVYADQVPSDVYQDRIDTALEVYNSGKADYIFISGKTESDYYDEVTPVVIYLGSKGIRESELILDYAGFDTYDSLYRAKYVYGHDSMIIVTQDFHLPRALYIANQLDIDAVGMLANSGEYFYNSSFNTSEQLAIFKAIFDTMFNLKPASEEIRTSNPAFD